jgi:ABC-type branched-subunit amino acid transport system ATPase component
MYVSRMRLYGVKCLRRDIPEEGELPEPARKRLLFQGANGSGKTTVLETIVVLWRMFGEWIDAGDGGRVRHEWTRHYLAESELAAVEFCDFDQALPSLWLAVGRGNAWQDLKNEHPGSQFAGLITFGAAKGEPKFTLELPQVDLASVRAQVQVGRISKPNVVYFPPEERLIAAAPQDNARLLNLTNYSWSAEYSPGLGIDNLLITVKAYDPQRYEGALSLANKLLANQNKRLLLRGRSNRHQVEVATEMEAPLFHSLDVLSSGEKQVVLMVVFAACLLHDGGLLIVDEPDLHIHMALAEPLVAALNHITRERKGQMIVAAHSQQVWKWFGQSAERIALSPWGARAK